MGRFAGFVSTGHGVTDLAAVTRSMVDEFVDAPTSTGTAPSPTVRHLRRCAVRFLFRKARGSGLVDGDPTLDPRAASSSADAGTALTDPEGGRCRRRRSTCSRPPGSQRPGRLARRASASGELAGHRRGRRPRGRRRARPGAGPPRSGPFHSRSGVWLRSVAACGRSPRTPIPGSHLRGTGRTSRSRPRPVHRHHRPPHPRRARQRPAVRPASVTAWAGRKVFEDRSHRPGRRVSGMRSLDRTARLIGLDHRPSDASWVRPRRRRPHPRRGDPANPRPTGSPMPFPRTSRAKDGPGTTRLHGHRLRGAHLRLRSARQVEAELSHRLVWRLVQRLVAKRTGVRLPVALCAAIITSTCVAVTSPWVRDQLGEIHRSAAADQARQIGLLDPGVPARGPTRTPPGRCTATARSSPPLPGTPRRHEARSGHGRAQAAQSRARRRLHWEGTGETAWGTKFVLLAARGADVRSRIILDAAFVPEPGGEAAAAMTCLPNGPPLTPRARRPSSTTPPARRPPPDRSP